MSNILVRPPELRQTSEQLKSSAKKIGIALQAIDNDILALKGDKFLGNRANAVQAHYAPKREALLKAREIVHLFSENLQTTADIFSSADNEKSNITTMGILSANSLIGSVLGANINNKDNLSYSELLKIKKDIQEELKNWKKNHSEDLEGWTIDKIDDAIASIQKFIKDLEQGIIDIKNPKDLPGFLMNIFTNADDEYIESAEGNIVKMKQLLDVYEDRKNLLIEKHQLEQQLTDINDKIPQAIKNLTLDQGDSDWAKIKMNNVTGETLGNYGCLQTVTAMIARYYGEDVTPVDVDKWIESNDGYYSSGSYMPPGSQEGFLNEVLNQDGTMNPISRANIEGNLNDGKPVILHINSPINPKDGHYVLAINTDSKGNYICIDPNGGKQYPLSANEILDARVYNP